MISKNESPTRSVVHVFFPLAHHRRLLSHALPIDFQFAAENPLVAAGNFTVLNPGAHQLGLHERLAAVGDEHAHRPPMPALGTRHPLSRHCRVQDAGRGNVLAGQR